MNNKLLKFSLACAVGVVIIAATPKSAMAYEEAVAGYVSDKTKSSEQSSAGVSSFSVDEIPIPGFINIGIADVDTNLMIRESAGENSKIIGKLPKDGGITVVEADNGKGWTKVSSGKLTGYVKSQYLITGTEASKLALKVGNYIATSNRDGLYVRKEPSTSSAVIDQVAQGEELLVIDPLVVNYNEEYNKWVKVSLDSDDSSDGDVGYVYKEYVDLSYALKKALSNEEINYGSGEVSSLRIRLIEYAKQFLGNPYVWAGYSLEHGIDCSGFTKKIYANYGYYIDRVSRDQARGGTKISASSLKPGDLVFYGNNSTGYISHVALYMGNGRIIHASNKRDGIKTSNLYYRQPIKCVRYINE